MSTTLNLPPIQTGPNPAKATHKSSARRQAIELQRLLSEDARTCVKPLERAAVARAWCDVNEEVRKLAMRPLPKPVDTTKLQTRGSRRAAAPAEPVEPGGPVTMPKAA